MNRRTFAKNSLKFAGTASVVSACGEQLQTSEALDLAQKSTKVETNETLITAAKERLVNTERFFQGSGLNEETEKRLLAHFSVLPAQYQDFLVKRNKDVGFHIEFQEQTWGGIKGLCYFDDIGGLRIKLPGDGIEFALIHESGHAFDNENRRQFEASTALQAAFTQARRSPSQDAGYIRGYAKSKAVEFWADGISTMLRGSEARKSLENMPITKKFFTEHTFMPPNITAQELKDPMYAKMRISEGDELTGGIAALKDIFTVGDLVQSYSFLGANASTAAYGLADTASLRIERTDDEVYSRYSPAVMFFQSNDNFDPQKASVEVTLETRYGTQVFTPGNGLIVSKPNYQNDLIRREILAVEFTPTIGSVSSDTWRGVFGTYNSIAKVTLRVGDEKITQDVGYQTVVECFEPEDFGS